jgi:putative DNA primase/helicase
VHKVLGDYAGDTPMQTLMQSRYGGQNTYDLAALEGKRLVIAQEGEASSKLAEAKLKAMTGGDPIACRPYGKPKTYDPRFKIVLVTNELPKIDGVDGAIWRRIKVIPFNVTIPQDRRDPYLKEKLLEEREGILNFLLGCFQEYEAAQVKSKGSGLFEPEVVIKEIQNYRTDADSVGMFIKLKCIVDKGKSSSTKQLYKAYSDWCYEYGIDEPLSPSHFGRNLGRKGYTQYKTSAGNGWKGIDIEYYDIDKVCHAGVRHRIPASSVVMSWRSIYLTENRQRKISVQELWRQWRHIPTILHKGVPHMGMGIASIASILRW